MTNLFPADENRIFGRLFYYVAEPIPHQNYTVHWNLIEGTGPGMQDTQSFTKLVRFGGTYNQFNGGSNFNFEERPRPTDRRSWGFMSSMARS